MADDAQQGSGVGIPVGEKIGKYEVCGRLGIGGQAIVYKCYDSLLDRFVAVKQISSHLAEDPRFLDRFRKEAQILAKLGAEQPAIVTIHELIEDERGLFIVMEFIEGVTLEKVLQSGPVETKAVLQILWRLAAALHVVHSAGIIHRDIKPSNIIVCDGLKAKIADFGVAASVSGQTSMLLGTTKYMAPELFGGESADGRVDMYSLGFIIYEMLLGREKFNEIFHDVVRDKHSEALRWMKWHGNEAVEAPLLHEVNPQIPPALSQIVAKMMCKDPEGRFESMEALGRAIKMAFSPKARAARGQAPARAIGTPGVTPMRQGAPGAAPVATATGEELLGEDEDLEVEIDPYATAEIPKAKMTRKTKLVLVAVMVSSALAIGVVWAVKARQKRIEVQAAAKKLFDSAMTSYKSEKYETAKELLEKLRKDVYKGTDQYTKAGVVLPVCKCLLAANKKDWITAQKQLGQAEKAVKDARYQLDKWAKGFEDDIRVIRNEMMAKWACRQTLQEARGELAKGNHEMAIRMVEDRLRMTQRIPEELRMECKGFVDDVRSNQFWSKAKLLVEGAEQAGARYLKMLDRDGHTVQTEAEMAQAMAAYSRADILDSPDAKILSDEQRKQLQDRIDAGRKRITDRSAKAKTLAKLEQLRKDGNRAEELKMLKALVKETPRPEWLARIKQIEMDAEKEAITRLLSEERLTEATAALEKYVAAHPDDKPMEALLKSIKQNRQLSLLTIKGEAAMREKNWAEAKKTLTEASSLAAGTPEDKKKIAELILECTFQIAFATCQGLAAEAKDLEIAGSRDKATNKLIEAERAYDKLLASHQKHAGEIQAEVAIIRRKIRYNNAIVQVKRAIDNNDFKGARDQLKAITPPKAETASLQRLSYYRQHLYNGQKAFADGNYKSAGALFALAEKYTQSQEEKDEVKKWKDRAEMKLRMLEEEADRAREGT